MARFAGCSNKNTVIHAMTAALLWLLCVSGSTANAQEDDLLAVDRPDAVYEEALTNNKPDRLVTSYTLGFYRSGDNAAQDMRNALVEFSAAGQDGPFVPRFIDRLSEATVEEFYGEYGMKFPYFPHNGSHVRPAMNAGATYTFARAYGSGERGKVACWDPCYMDAANAAVEEWLKKYGGKPWVSCILGFDEPLNYAGTIRDPRNVKLVNKDIREKYGVKLSLTAQDTILIQPWTTTDPGILNKNPVDVALLRVSVWRWLNDRLYEAAKREYDIIQRYAPHLEYHAYNRNAINIMDFIDKYVPNSIDRIDQARLYDVTDGFSADPYPTCNLKRDGQTRALYHVGFIGKLITDLAVGRPSKIIMQGFKFHDRMPTRANIREWTSQAAKTGVTHLEWFGDQRYVLPDFYCEVLRMCRLWKDLPALDIPETSKIDVIFSDDSRNALNDDLMYAHYTLHVLLGEKLGAWYRFAGDNYIRRGIQTFDDAELIIAPQMGYVSRDFADKLTARIESGATLVVLDPDALTWDIETGSLDAQRKRLLGSSLWKARDASHMLPTEAGGKRFPGITHLLIQPGKTGVIARAVKPPRGATVLFTYQDGAPAAYSRRIGKGEVIVFGAMPFGDSALALQETGWNTLFAALCDELAIKRNLPIWRFLLPECGGEVATFELLDNKPAN